MVKSELQEFSKASSFMDTLTEPKALYDASRISVQRQMRGPRLLVTILLGSVPVSILLLALNSPIGGITCFLAMFSPIGLVLRWGLQQASSDSLEIYEGTVVGEDDAPTAVCSNTYTPSRDFIDILQGRRSQSPITTYWVTMDVKRAYRIEKTGEISEFTPETPKRGFQVFRGLRREIAKSLLPNQDEVLAVAPSRSWVFQTPVLLGRLQDLQQTSR